MPSPSELQRYDEHGAIKAGVVFDRAPRFESTDGTALDRCRVEQPARVNRRTGEAEHPAERAAREYNAAAVISLPEVVELRQRVAELEAELAAKNRFVAAMCERLKAAHDVLARHAERAAERDPWPLDELEQYAGEHV